MLAGVATAGEPRLTGGISGCGVRGTDRPFSPCDTLRCRVVEALWEDKHGRRGDHYPCAARGTNVYPRVLACLAMTVTLRSRYCAS